MAAQRVDRRHGMVESLDSIPVEENAGVEQGSGRVGPMAGSLDTVARNHRGPNCLYCMDLIL